MNKTTVFIGIAVIGAIVVMAALLTKRTSDQRYEFIVAEKTNLIREVNVTGKVVPAQRINLDFEINGRVSAIMAKVGDIVTSGQEIASLEQNSIHAELLSAQATQEVQEAKLAELIRGTRTEEITLAETKVTNASRTLEDTRTNLANVKAQTFVDLHNLYAGAPNILNNAFIQADDAVNKKIDALFEDDTSNNPRLSFISSNSQYQSEAQQKRLIATTVVNTFTQELNSLSADHKDIDAELQQAIAHLNKIQDLLTVLLNAVNTATGISQSTISTYKSDINAARTNINTALTAIDTHIQTIAGQNASNQISVSAAQKQVNDAISALAAANDELALKRAGATEEQINAQRAAVEEAHAQKARIQTQLEKTVLRAPLGGTITAKNIHVGEIVSPATVAFSLISNATLEIEAFIPETDIAYINRDNPARITLDAYTDDAAFSSRVISIDPAETIIENVATYKTKLVFDAPDERIRPGMTANISIITAQKNDIIVIPQRAIQEEHGKQFIRVLSEHGGNAPLETREIKTGMRDGRGNIEILSGAYEGDKVVTFIKEK